MKTLPESDTTSPPTEVVSRDETPTERPPARSMHGGRRALDYRRGHKRMQRCSRCHSELELAKPVLYDLSNQALSEPVAYQPIMVGDELLGFCCPNCKHSLLQHICSVFPESNGFPIVDHHGQIMETPRCADCGTALGYGASGMVVCPHCDTDPLQVGEMEIIGDLRP